MGCRFFLSDRAPSNFLRLKNWPFHTSHILDNFTFFCPKESNIASKGLKTFELLAQSLQLPLKQEKTVLPASRVILFGILIDTVAMRLEHPEEKLLGAKDMINNLLQCKKKLL